MDEETIKWVLSDKTVDPVSHVQYAAVVFMLYYSLELKHSLLKTSEQLIKDLPSDVHKVGETSLYVAGSAAQGFYLHTDDYLEARDIDVVAVYEKDIREECEYDKEDLRQKIKEQLGDNDDNQRHQNENEAGLCEDKTKTVNVTKESDPTYLNIETWEDTYPGYVMLRKCRKHEFPVQPSLRNRYVSSFETAQSRADFWRDVLPYLGEEFRSILDHPRDKEADVYPSIQTQGPSTCVSICHRSLYLCIDADLVYALRYPRNLNTPGATGWPEIARKWLERKPKSGWPSAKLKNDILSSGCLLVPKGHMGSKREEYEWRVSFSLAELKLARSLNRIQREIAHTLKAVLCEEQYEYGQASVNAKLDSYFILNTLFAESENIAPESWQEKNIVIILFQLLDKLATSIKTKNLPHYFVEENNLLYKLLVDEVKIGKGEFKRGDSDSEEMMNSDEYSGFALYTVLRLRHDPLRQLLQQGSYHRLPGSLHDAVFGPFVNEAKSSTFEPTAYASTLVKLANAHLYMNNFNEANIYIKDAEAFYNALGDKDPSITNSEFMATKAVCSYMTGEYNTAHQILESLHKNEDDMYYEFLKENEVTVVTLSVKAMISDAGTKTEAYQKLARAKSKELFEKALSLNFDTSVALELMNFYMITGCYPEAQELLLKIEDNVKEEDKYFIEPMEEDPETRVYYGEDVYAVPLVEEPISIVDHWEADDDDDVIVDDVDDNGAGLEKDIIAMSQACQEGSAASDKKEVDNYCVSDEIDESCEPASKKAKYAESEAEMELEKPVHELEMESKTSDALSSVETGYSKLESKKSIEAEAVDEAGMLDKALMDQGEQSVSTHNLGRVDILQGHLADSDNEMKQGSDDIAYEEVDVLYKRVDEVDNQFDFKVPDDEMDSRPMVNFYKNHDLINLSALERAFTELGLHDDAQRVRDRLLDHVNERKKVDEKVTVEALEHDLSLYMSYVQKPSIRNDWENPLSIFSGGVLYTTADVNILDEVLKSLIQKCQVIRLKVNDLYYHHNIQLLKLDGKKSEAYDMVNQIKNENLKSIHYQALGYEVEARIAEQYASYRRDYEPVYNMVSKWMKKLVDAVSKFEPRNTYLESVFK